MSRKKRKHRPQDDVEEMERVEEAGYDAEAVDTSPGPAEPGPSDPLLTIEELRREASEMRDLAQRKQAEFENYRKRMERERVDLGRYSGAETVKEVLPVLDNLERAVLAGSMSSEEQFRAGIAIIQRQLSEILARLGVTEVEGKGKPFDPHVHEAVSRIETEKELDGTVLEVLQKGYWYKDRLLRPAMVSVARSPEGEGKESGGDAEPEGTASEAVPNSE